VVIPQNVKKSQNHCTLVYINATFAWRYWPYGYVTITKREYFSTTKKLNLIAAYCTLLPDVREKFLI
jgi:hypothetical protein